MPSSGSDRGIAPLIETAELAERIGDPHLILLDASWHMPAEERDAQQEFLAQRLPNARFFDIDAISDAESPYPHMIPSPENFSHAASQLGIGAESDIVVYDTKGLFSAARGWWMFRLFGHRQVRVLNGGLPKWLAEGRAIETGPAAAPATGDFTAHWQPSRLATAEQIATRSQNLQIVDARSADRFAGSAPEPRAGLRHGHIPGSFNLPWADLLQAPYHTFKSPAALKNAFAAAGIDAARPIITTCGSGISACMLALGLALIGHDHVAVYDGSWAEWGSRAELPIAVGTD